MSYKKIVLLNLTSIVSILLMFSFTNPNTMGLLYTTIVLLLFYVFSITVFMLVLKVAYDKQLTNKRMIFNSLVLGIILPLLLAVSSLSALRALDIILIVSIPLVIVWYVQKRNLL